MNLSILIMLIGLPTGLAILPPEIPPHQYYAEGLVTWYDPALCDELPTNCYDPEYWWRMAAGNDARLWYDRAVACPAELPIGTKVEFFDSRWGLLDGTTYYCLDRGGGINMIDDIYHFDVLTRTPIQREVLRVRITLPVR